MKIIKGNDVVTVPRESPATAHVGMTFRPEQLLHWISQKIGSLSVVFSEGINCEYLGAAGGGWKKGKVKLVIVFEEDGTNSVG